MRNQSILFFIEILLLTIITCISQREVRALKCPGKCIDDPGSCRLLGGKIIGYCLNEQACCDLTQINGGSCDSTVSNAKVSYFRSPNYPKESGGDLICEMHLELNNGTLGVKLDFIVLQMDTLPFDLSDFALSQTPVCGSDMMFIKGFHGWSPDPRCGNLTGYSILIETENDQKRLSLIFVMASLRYKWNIRLTQVSEMDVDSQNALLYNNLGNPNSNTISEIGNKITMTSTSNIVSTQKAIKPYSDVYDQNGIRIDRNETPEESDEKEGKELPMLRIAGGQDADEYSIPWQVSIQSVPHFESQLCGVPKNMSIHLCGGSIIDERTILTAAHCFYSPSRFSHPTVPVDQLKVVVGEFDMCRSEEFSKEYSISEVIFHYNYFAKEILNDLAIIRLSEPIEFNRGARPITMADTDFDMVDKPTLLSGWGSFSLDENLTFPSTLQKTSDLILLTENDCVSRQIAYLNYNLNATYLPKKYEGSLSSWDLR